MGEESPQHVVAAGAVEAEPTEPTEDELRAFGRSWVEWFELDPDEEITYSSADGTERVVPLGDVALISPHSIPAFTRLGELLELHDNDADHPEVAAHAETIMGWFNHYRGVQTPPVAG